MRLSKILRISKWEVTKSTGDIDRRTGVLVLLGVLAVGALVLGYVQAGAVLDQGIYRVGVSEDSEYYEAVELSDRLVAREPSIKKVRNGDLDVSIDQNGDIRYHDSKKGKAAVSELRSAVQNYNRLLMSREADEGRGVAAFPVRVNLLYVNQNITVGGGDTGDGAGGGGGGATGGGTGGGTGGTGSDTGQTPVPSVSGGGGSNIFDSNEGATTPSGISPPFPFESLILAFAFIVPMNFIIQAYASSMIDERINRRGELLLISPVTRFDVIAGKTLPYFVGMLGVASLTAGGIGYIAGELSARSVAVMVSAVVPVMLAFLSTSFVGAMFSRSFKELTFVTVSISVFLTAYVFIPAIFTDVHPIAVISPITLVVNVLEGSSVAVSDYVFSTVPLYLTSGVLFALGGGVYREEDMFTQRPVPLKALDSVASLIYRRLSVFKLSILLIPFVFGAELLGIATLFALPVGVSVPALMVMIAVIEEVAKSVHIYAGFEKSYFERTRREAVVLGSLSGFGFFVGEKITLITQLVGLPNLELGRAAFGGHPGLPTALGLLLAPLVLHVVTASVSSLGASRGKRGYAIGLAGAVVIHAVYNITVVTTLGI
ncbi:MAG: ABC transporter permease subunit [Halobacteria archaeon]|nr:ABC transporter permease subunit [Halobacteria archaeon]